MPALLLVGTFEAGGEVHRMVGLHVEIVKVRLQFVGLTPCACLGPQMIQTDRIMNKIKAFAFRLTRAALHG